MSVLGHFPFQQVSERGSIREADVEQLRSLLYKDGAISQEEVEQLIALNACCAEQVPAWDELFREVLVDYVVRQAEPQGYVTQGNAEWLIGKLAPDGVLTERRDLDLVIEIIDVSRWCPEVLIAFALGQVSQAVTNGIGPLRDESRPKGTIADDKVELVRRMIYAFGGDGNIAVTRSEAELLCDINDNLDPEQLSDAWTDLYVKAMANFLLGASGYSVPTREEALRSQMWLESRGELLPGELIRSIVNTGLDDILSAYRRSSLAEQTVARLEQQRRHLITEEVLTRDEAEWLTERLTRDGGLTPAENALITYVQENALEIDPRFNDWLTMEPDAA